MCKYYFLIFTSWQKKSKIVQVGDDDHTADSRCQIRGRKFVEQNTKWDTEFESTKINIPIDVLVDFTAMYSNYRGVKLDNHSENIQRIELLNMKNHFKSLQKSKLTYVRSFYGQFTKAVGQHEFIVKSYLT